MCPFVTFVVRLFIHLKRYFFIYSKKTGKRNECRFNIPYFSCKKQVECGNDLFFNSSNSLFYSKKINGFANECRFNIPYFLFVVKKKIGQ